MTAWRTLCVVAAIVVAGETVGTIAPFWLVVKHGVSLIAVTLFAAMYVLSTLGVTIGFHRYFSHRSFQTSRSAQVLFVILGSMAFQGPLVYWVSTHRRHHQFSDIDDDTHSPHLHGPGLRGWCAGFWHSHMGWLFLPDITNVIRFVPDILCDSLIFRGQQLYLLWATIGLAVPALIGFITVGPPYSALEAFLWGGPVRLFLVSNASWAVGSICHLYGRRPFETGDHSANNFWVSLMAFGEGLQNTTMRFPMRHVTHFAGGRPT